MANGNITVGTIAIAKVGRNAVEVEIVAESATGIYLVRSRTGKEFKTNRLEPIGQTADRALESTQERLITLSGEVPSNYTQTNSSFESSFLTPQRMSLFNAAIEVLRRSETPLNTREIITRATELGLWSNYEAKTPEQTLYSAIFREIATKEVPRIVKAEVRGKFKLNSEAFPAEPEA